MTASRITRRALLGRAAGLAGGLLAFPSILPAAAIRSSANSAINLALIGCGSRMGGVNDAFRKIAGTTVVAVCDVMRDRRQAYGRRLGLGDKDQHADFRDVLARTDVDAVLIATPDHWHVPMSIAAMEAGKDVYCEKPLSNTIGEGRALVRCAARHGTVFQHGTQLHSYEAVRRACELVRNGFLGNLKEIRIGSPPGLATGIHPEMPVPDGLDYERWLGPAAWAPYTRARVFDEQKLPGWYFIADYSRAGWIAGYGVHDLDIAQWAIGMERSGPVSIEGQGVYPSEGLFDTVTTYRILFTYANGMTITMTDTGQNRHGVLFVGDRGRIFVRYTIEAEPASLLREVIPPSGVHLYRSPDHAQNFIDCIRTRAETITPPEIAHRATSTALLGGIACRLGRRLRWDPVRERFLDDAIADRLLDAPLRAPWRI